MAFVFQIFDTLLMNSTIMQLSVSIAHGYEMKNDPTQWCIVWNFSFSISLFDQWCAPTSFVIVLNILLLILALHQVNRVDLDQFHTALISRFTVKNGAFFWDTTFSGISLFPFHYSINDARGTHVLGNRIEHSSSLISSPSSK